VVSKGGSEIKELLINWIS
jgi:hypothetical protein